MANIRLSLLVMLQKRLSMYSINFLHEVPFISLNLPYVIYKRWHACTNRAASPALTIHATFRLESGFRTALKGIVACYPITI